MAASTVNICPRLVDYVCFVGARYPNSNSVAQTPELLRRYPAIDHADFQLPPDVVFFCQPEGCISVSQKRVPLRDASSFVFTLTDKETGVIRYGICVNFFRPFDRKYVAEAKARTNKGTLDENFRWCDETSPNHRQKSNGSSNIHNCSAESISQCSTDSDNISFNGAQDANGSGAVGNRLGNGGGRLRKWRQRNNTLTSLCLISHHPFFSTFRECVFQLRKLIRACNERSCSRRVGGSKNVLRDSVWGVLSGCTVSGLDGSQPLSPVIIHDVKEIEHWVMRLLSAPAPIPGKTRVEVELLPRSISAPVVFALPDETRFALCDFPLHLPLELLGVETCMRVLTCILLEHKIVLQSRDYNALSMSVLAFVKMLYPLEYMFPVIPLLPTCMNFAEQLLLAPTPYIIGVPATFFLYKQSFRLPDDVWVVDLDSNKITVPLNADELPRIVEPEATSLRNHLKGALASMSMPQPIQNLDDVDISRFQLQKSDASSPNGSSARDAFNPYICGNDVDSIDVATRVAMVKFFSSPNILANHEEHMRTLRLFPRPVVAFQLNSFLKSRPNHSAFTAKLARTQAVEYFCEWSLSPSNMTFRRIQTSIIDPGVIGDKSKWFSNQLTPINFPICSEGSSLAAALSVPEEPEDDSDANLTDESADDDNSVCQTLVGGGSVSACSGGDGTSLKSSSSYSSLTEFVSDMRSSEINGDCLPVQNVHQLQKLLIDQTSYRLPSTLVVPQCGSEVGVETPCRPYIQSDYVSSTNPSAPHVEATHGVLIGSDGSAGIGTSDTDNDAESLHSESDDPANPYLSRQCSSGSNQQQNGGSGGGSNNEFDINKPSANSLAVTGAARKSEHEFKNPLYDSSATSKAVSVSRNASSIAAPKRMSDKNSKGQQQQQQPHPVLQDSGFVSRSQSLSVSSTKSSRQSSSRSEIGANTSAYDKGDRTAFVEKSASVLRSSTRKTVAGQINSGAARMNNAFDRNTFSENQQFLAEVVSNCLDGQTPGYFSLKKLRKLLENESLRAYVVGKIGANCDKPVSKDFLEDQEVSKKVFNSMGTVLKAVICGLEESIKAANFTGMASIFMLLELAYTHVFIRDLSSTRKGALPSTSAAAASTTAEMIKEQSLKKVEGVFDSATKGLNQSLNFILSGEGGVNFSSSANITNVPPNSPNVSKCHSPSNTSYNTSYNETSSSSTPRTPAPAGVYSYPSSSNSSYSTSASSTAHQSASTSVMGEGAAANGCGGGGNFGTGNNLTTNLSYTQGVRSPGAGVGGTQNSPYFTYPNNVASHQQKELTSVSHIESTLPRPPKLDDRSNPKITVDKPSRSTVPTIHAPSDDLQTEVDAKRKQLEALHSMDSTGSEGTGGSGGIGAHCYGGGATSAFMSSNAPNFGESDASSGAETPASGGFSVSAPTGTGGSNSAFRRISHHSIRSTDSEFELTSQGLRQMPQLGSQAGGSTVPRIPNIVKQVKSVYCNGYRYYNGILMKLENMPPQEENPKKYLFELLIESGRSPLWDNLQFWEDCFLDAVAAEREAVGMDQSPAEMLTRFKTLGLDEQKRIEAEEDRLLATTLHNMIAFMLAMKLNPKDIKKKARRLLGRSHIGLGFSKEVNDLLDRLHYLAGNDVDLKPPVSRQLRKQCFVVHAGVDNTGDVLFLEVCEDSVILRSGNGVICERLFYEKLINMSYSPSTKVLCLWKRLGSETVLSKYYTKKCKQLYYAIKESMERAATRIRNETPELGGEFAVEDISNGECGVLQVTLDGISLNFSGRKTFIDLRDIKKCNTKKGLFVLQEYIPERREIIVRKFKSAQANEICYAVLCVFSMVAAASSPCGSAPGSVASPSLFGGGSGGSNNSSTIQSPVSPSTSKKIVAPQTGAVANL